ncbi:low-density lipoprotein receptor 1 [Biomphalaria glabrata]|nr:low-density lipoprotein receptor 1 [Biomphalaria glabrata]
MTFSIVLVTSIIMAATMFSMTHAHGRMLDPVSRMSAYILGFPTPVNYNDHEMFCGGRAVQWQQNGGKCGICGDPWSGPRNYERPEGALLPKDVVITKTYQERDVINILLQITANHMGWHEFRVCNVESSGGIEATHECLNQNLLTDSTGKSRFYLDSSSTGFYNYTLVLPSGLTCTHCLLQWKWHCGNDWNCDETGACGLGFGPQEEFYACSDVTISPRNGTAVLPTSATTSATSTTKPTTAASSTTISSTTSVSNPSSSNAAEETTTISSVPTAPTTSSAATTKFSDMSTLKVIPSDTTKPSYADFWSNIIKMASNITNSTSSTKINYNDPEYIKMLLGYPNSYNPYSNSTSSVIKFPTVPLLPTNQLAKDRVCAACYYGCLINGCSTSCPEICPRKLTG